jgi:small conductance mechanosensitive channel
VTRCKLVRSILEQTEEKKATREFLDELCECLEIRTISIYDAGGKRRESNSLRKQTAITADSPAAVLLEGRESFVGEREKDEISGETIQSIGVPRWNPDGTVGGMVLIETDSNELERIRANLGFESVFEQISLTDGTFVLVIDDKELTVKYVGEVEGGIFKKSLNGYDYTGLRASAMGINENLLLDHYNGEMFVLKNRYFASARRVGDYYFLVMRPPVTVAENHMTPILIAVGGTLVYMGLLFLVSTLGRKAERVFAGDRREAPEEAGAANDGEEEKKHRDDDVLVMLSSIVNKNKPYFEERWPEDSVRWKDRTPGEKFILFLKISIILALAALLLHAVISGENSVWYYCISGEWNSGINLYSITTCVIDITLLLVIKMVLHKLLYWIARAVRAKGETICHLLNSFSSYILAITGIFLCLANFGVDLTTLSLTGGVLGVIFGIGCQHIVADILAGILMTFEGSVHVGDFVSYNGQYGVILSIGVRTTQLKWFSETTVVRNNDFKNYINMPSEKTDRVTTYLTVDLAEPLERVEGILEEELPKIHEKLCEISGSEVGGPKYRGVSKITESGVVLSFSIYCKGMYYGWLQRMLNRELKLMCERRDIRIAMNQMVLHGETENGQEREEKP